MILFVGTDGRRKGLPQLLAALADMPSPFKGLLVIAGNDPPSRWMPAVRESRLEGHVRFHGREARVERLYAAADLVVLASVFEGFGNVVPEAMACGCPVLTSRSVGAADFVDHGENGWIVESCNHHEAYSALLHDALQVADLEAMGRRAAEKVAPCTWDWSMDRLEEVYRLICEEKRKFGDRLRIAPARCMDV
jgi:UDP-glucose:(heptosyl)LPS alpha-1,3-glucosyltransferase